MSQEIIPLCFRETIASRLKGSVHDLTTTLLWDSEGGICSDSCVYLFSHALTREQHLYKIFTSQFLPFLPLYPGIQNALCDEYTFAFREEDIQDLSVVDTRFIDQYKHGLPPFGLTCNWQGECYTITNFVTRVLRLPESENISVDPCTGDLLYGPIPFVQGETIQDLYNAPGNWTFIDYYLKKVQHVITQQSGMQFRVGDKILGAVGINHKLEKIKGNTAYTTITDIGDSIEMLVKLNSGTKNSENSEFVVIH